MGDHALCCSASGLWRRHNEIRDVFVLFLSRAGFHCTLEVELPGSERRPADIFISQGWGSRPVALDISVVHPLGANFHHGDCVAGAAAETREKAKIALYGQACEAAGWDFVPLVVETTGAWGHRAQVFISALLRKQASRFRKLLLPHGVL